MGKVEQKDPMLEFILSLPPGRAARRQEYKVRGIKRSSWRYFEAMIRAQRKIDASTERR